MLQPIESLSAELLQDIFYETVLNGSQTLREQVVNANAFSQVCRRWRKAALDYGKIWALIIDFNHSSPLWVSLLLERSKPHPVDFGTWKEAQVLDNSARSSETLEVVFGHISRLRTFKLETGWPDCWMVAAQHIFEAQAQNLEILQLPKHLTENPPILCGNAPRLRTLDLRSTYLDIKSLHIPSLVELTVSSLDSELTVNDWVKILVNGMPNLKWLSLTHAVSAEDSTDGPIEFANVGRNLEMLILRESKFSTCMKFIHALSLPPTCGIQIRSDMGPLYEESQHKLTTLIKNRLRSWSVDTPNRYFGLEYVNESYGGRGTIVISNVRNKDSVACLDAKESFKGLSKQMLHDPELVLELGIREEVYSEAVPLLHTLLKLLEPTLLTTTELRLAYNSLDVEETNSLIVFKTFLTALFSSLEGLDKLTLSQNAYIAALPLLTSNPPISLPALKRLAVDPPPYIHAQGYDEVECISVIRECLRERKQAGHPITHLIMRGPNIRLASFETALGELVDLAFEL